MAESPFAEVVALLESVRRRWMAARAMRGVARAASVALLALGLVLVVDRAFAPPDLVMALLASCSAGAFAGFAAWVLWPVRRGPSDRQVARYIEEHCPELQDRLASAIDLRETPSPFGGRVLHDAARLSRGVDLDRVVAGSVVRGGHGGACRPAAGRRRRGWSHRAQRVAVRSALGGDAGRRAW
ncbi:MAG: hypothetical protein OXG72_13065 [Acidobacteria bacterium]|nr:hypothetical protein [Acidobacteriota bacterium]